MRYLWAILATGYLKIGARPLGDRRVGPLVGLRRRPHRLARSGRRPFKAVARVRIPLGPPPFSQVREAIALVTPTLYPSFRHKNDTPLTNRGANGDHRESHSQAQRGAGTSLLQGAVSRPRAPPEVPDVQEERRGHSLRDGRRAHHRHGRVRRSPSGQDHGRGVCADLAPDQGQASGFEPRSLRGYREDSYHPPPLVTGGSTK